MEDDWDLQAVVRRFSNTIPSSDQETAAMMTTMTNAAGKEDAFTLPPPLFLQDESGDHLVLDFPNLTATGTAMQELEQLYKPFFPQIQKTLPPSPPPSTVKTPPMVIEKQKPSLQRASHSQISRSKRRKNQQKKVVCQVPAEGLSSDMWAWRKYGQKPIKGSPYPRGYYRCSSSKGCLARKQVERSRTDPNMFIITYTSEHNHSLPTHRNSLAGSTRHKSAETMQVQGQNPEGPAQAEEPKATSTEDTITAPVSAGLSPTSPLTVSMEEELLGGRQQGEGRSENEGDLDLEEGELLLADEMFDGLEELQWPSIDGPTVEDCFSGHFATAITSS